jgi:alpha-galactosidase
VPEVRFEETERGPALDNGVVRVEVHLNKGTYDVIDATTGRRVLTDAAVAVQITDGPTLTSRGEGLELAGTDDVEDAHGRGIELTLTRETYETEPEVHLTLTLYEDRRFVIAQAEVQNRGPSPLRIRAFRPLDGATVTLEAAGSALRFYKNGWQSWSPSLVLDCAEPDGDMAPPTIGPGTQPDSRHGRFTSDAMAAIVNPATNVGALAGFISNADQFSHVWLDAPDATLTAASWADGVAIAARQVMASERLLIDVTSQPLAALCVYGDAVAREMDAVPSDAVASGWCSWYYYFQGISEAEVLANLDYIAADRESLPFEYVQIDDGYQSEIGDWLTTNGKFPGGMKALADAIHERGFKAGLWVAPFLAGAKSRIFAEHPDWFVKFSTGMPAIATMNWGQMCFALDTTNPDCAAWLTKVFRTICDDWGYDYVKIDFIFAAGVDGVRHDPGLTRAQAYRRGLEIVRDAVGDRFVLACGNPQLASVGLVEGARIGPDVAPYWKPFDRAAPRTILSDPAAINSIRNTIARFWMHGRLWQSDPDCLLVRETDTALTQDEMRSLATVIAMSGGMVLDSDRLPKITDARRDVISLLLPVYGKAAIPVDLFQTPDVARILSLDCGTHRMLAVFDWADEASDVNIDLPDGKWHAFDLWTEEWLGLGEGTLPLSLSPHGCAFLRLTPDAGRPQVVGSTFHAMQGALEIASEEWDGSKLRVRLRPVAKRDGAIFIADASGVRRVDVTGLTDERELEA